MYNTISRVLIDNKGFKFHEFFPEEWMACEEVSVSDRDLSLIINAP